MNDATPLTMKNKLFNNHLKGLAPKSVEFGPFLNILKTSSFIKIIFVDHFHGDLKSIKHIHMCVFYIKVIPYLSKIRPETK